MFTGLSAFPLTPMNEEQLNESDFVRLLQHIAAVGVDSIGVLGSTGSYAYLSKEERKRIVELAIANVTTSVPNCSTPPCSGSSLMICTRCPAVHNVQSSGFA